MSRQPAARPDAIRRHNLGLLVREVHQHGALTRVELTTALGLNRSTIGVLVSDLVSLGLITERVPGSGDRAGRPSHVVGPREDGPYVVAVDVQVDRLTLAAVGLGGIVIARDEVSLGSDGTPARETAALAAKAIEGLCGQLAGRPTVGVGVSVPASLSRSDGRVLFAPNLRWREEPFGELLDAELRARSLRTTIMLGNDANLAAMAERLRGAARGSEDLIYLVGRIGVGAGIISSGALLPGAIGLAGEVGHAVLDSAGPLCHCGSHGCVEMYIGDAALMQQAGRTDAPSRERVGALIADARGGNLEALAAVRRTGRYLGRTIANLVNILNPQVVVAGGTLGAVLDLAEAEVADAVHEFAIGAACTDLILTPTTLADEGPLVGAAELVFARLLEDPIALADAVSA